MNSVKEERSLGDLISDLARESSALIRKEGELARAELSEKASQLQHGLIALVLGAAVMIAGLFYVLDAVVFGIGELLPPDLSPWLAALLVGLAVGGIGYALIKTGQEKLKPENLTPERTIKSLKKDQELIKEQI